MSNLILYLNTEKIYGLGVQVLKQKMFLLSLVVKLNVYLNSKKYKGCELMWMNEVLKLATDVLVFSCCQSLPSSSPLSDNAVFSLPSFATHHHCHHRHRCHHHDLHLIQLFKLQLFILDIYCFEQQSYFSCEERWQCLS